MEEIRTIVAANHEMMGANYHRIAAGITVLGYAAAVAIALAIFALCLFVLFQRDMNKKLEEIGQILILVREYSMFARDQKVDAKKALTDMKGESEKTQTMVVGAIEQAAVKAAAIVANTPQAVGTEVNPLQVHLVDQLGEK